MRWLSQKAGLNGVLQIIVCDNEVISKHNLIGMAADLDCMDDCTVHD